jgi:hypothetical protein
MTELTTLKAHIESVEPTPIKQLFYKPQRVHYRLPGFIYYLRIEVEGMDAPLYKLGFTLDVYKRIHTLINGKVGIKAHLIACHRFPHAHLANSYEATFHRIYTKSRHRSLTPILNSGNSELYVKDILGLDK